MNAALNIYHRLPPVSRSAVASLRGYYLNWWRYDRQTEKLVEEALERDTWNDAQWTAWRDERLAYLLERAATKVPYYRRFWSERRGRGEKMSWTSLENWPILEKEVLRAAPREFVADDQKLSTMFHDHTSGTTGTPLNVWSTKETVKLWYALFEARSRRWYGLSRRDRWAIFGGQLVTPFKQRKPPFWVWNAGMNQLYCSSYHLAPEFVPSYIQALNRYRIRYILGYPSAIYSIAQECLRQGYKAPKMDVVISNAEPLFTFQREAISQAFDCPVRETYGMAEIAAAASECKHGSLHQWPDTGIIEVGAADGDSSDLICTGLVNMDMPLIRYRVGDRGKLSTQGCSCGRNLPVIESIEGRSDDVLYTSEGRRIGRLDPIFKGDLSIKEAQIIQETLTTIRVKYVPTADLHAKALDPLAKRIRERLGDIEIVFEMVQKIPRTSRGKYRAVVCNLSESERSKLDSSVVPFMSETVV